MKDTIKNFLYRYRIPQNFNLHKRNITNLNDYESKETFLPFVGIACGIFLLAQIAASLILGISHALSLGALTGLLQLLIKVAYAILQVWIGVMASYAFGRRLADAGYDPRFAYASLVVVLLSAFTLSLGGGLMFLAVIAWIIAGYLPAKPGNKFRTRHVS